MERAKPNAMNAPAFRDGVRPATGDNRRGCATPTSPLSRAKCSKHEDKEKRPNGYNNHRTKRSTKAGGAALQAQCDSGRTLSTKNGKALA